MATKDALGSPSKNVLKDGDGKVERDDVGSDLRYLPAKLYQLYQSIVKLVIVTDPDEEDVSDDYWLWKRRRIDGVHIHSLWFL